MGNSQTKEARGQPGSSIRRGSGSGSGSPAIGQDSNNISDSSSRPSHPRRGSRHDFSFLGIGGPAEQDPSTLEQRRENKAEREARKAEKERQVRLKERERSMREEHVDGGYLVTQGVYVGVEDYNKVTVRQLMIERRLAPFWRGLNDFSESWAEHQLMAAARGIPIPPADHVPPELEYSLAKHRLSDTRDRGVTISANSTTQSFQSEHSQSLPQNNNSLSLPPGHGVASSPTAPFARARARTLASLTSSRHNGSTEANPREFQLPPDPFVNGQPIEVYLYKDATECPICFLYYPPYLNTTRCCEQPICSECFVQIKRPDPHPPEHEQPDPNAPPMSEEDRLAQAEGLLVSEVATCPYCKQPEFGITYVPPPIRRGLTYGTGTHPYQAMSPMSSQTSLSSGQMSPGPGRRRGISLSASAPEVITTDKVRPDWTTKLHAARSHAARRAAAATALHTAAYLMGPQDRAGFSGFGRRGIRRPTLEGESNNEAQRAAMAFLVEQHNQSQDGNSPNPRGSSSRRSRIDDIEELMMIEAIRMSLASEEERRRKEEKEAKKKAKKEEKESRKAEKAARKNSFLGALPSPSGESSSLLERSLSNTSSLTPEESATKGKGVERSIEGDDNQAAPPANSSTVVNQGHELGSPGMPIPLAAEPFRRSHLRQMSNASSASSSFAEAGMNYSASGTPTGNAPVEPMFNFRSLTAMITDDEKADKSSHIENKDGDIDSHPFFETLDERSSGTGPSPLAHSESVQNETENVGKKPDILIESAGMSVADKHKPS